jgi:hypothetical protein
MRIMRFGSLDIGLPLRIPYGKAGLRATNATLLCMDADCGGARMAVST